MTEQDRPRPASRPKKHRRVRVNPSPGADPDPFLGALDERAKAERPEAWGDTPDSSNDAQLKRDKPPHWG